MNKSSMSRAIAVGIVSLCCFFILVVSAVEDPDSPLGLSTTLEQYLPYPDEVSKQSELQLNFFNYNIDRDLNQFTFTVEDASSMIQFSDHDLRCEERWYSSVMTISDNRRVLTLELTFDDPSEPARPDFTCTTSITNPSLPTNSATMNMSWRDASDQAQTTDVALPDFVVYYDLTVQVTPQTLHSEAQYSFNIPPDNNLEGGQTLQFLWDPQYELDSLPTGICTDSRGSGEHTYTHEDDDQLITITFAEGYEFHLADILTCTWANPRYAPTSLAYAHIYTQDGLYRSRPAVLPTFLKPKINVITLTPSTTTMEELSTLTIAMEIFDYLPSGKDRYVFNTWVTFETGSACIYGEGGDHITPVTNIAGGGFIIEGRDEFVWMFPDGKITLECSGFVVTTPHEASTTNLFELSDANGYKVSKTYPFPAYLNSWLISFSTSSTIPQATGVTNTWRITTTSAPITIPSFLNFNVTQSSIIGTCTGAELDPGDKGSLTFKIPANSIKADSPYDITCQVTNQPYEKDSAAGTFRLFSNAAQYFQGTVYLPAYSWPNSEQLIQQIYFTEINPRWTEDWWSKFNSAIKSTYNIAKDDFFILDHEVQDHTIELDYPQDLVVIIAYLPSTRLTPEQLDQSSDKLSKKIAKFGWTKTEPKVSFAATNYGYPQHCLDSKLTPVSESDVDCGNGREIGKGGLGCKPCANDKKCFDHASCLSQRCEIGVCRANGAIFVSTMMALILAIIVALMF